MQTIKNDQKKLEKLINIARPIDLPPLQLNKENNDTGPDAKKKFQLPLFGKRGTFKFSTTTTAKKAIPAVNASSSSSSSTKEYKSDEEEMEDGDENVEKIKDLEKIEKQQAVNEINSEIDADLIEQTSNNESQCIDEDKLKSRLSVDFEKGFGSLKREQSIEDDLTAETSSATTVKKRRSRVRIRNDRGRDNVDINDTEEAVDIEKYSTWIPPENQCGDGSTNLNVKYGY